MGHRDILFFWDKTAFTELGEKEKEKKEEKEDKNVFIRFFPPRRAVAAPCFEFLPTNFFFKKNMLYLFEREKIIFFAQN